MTKKDCISVIVPVYKVEKYLSKCIQSIISQSYTNLDIILIDDGSPDNCGSICDSFAKIDTRIRVIHKVNGGLSDARNAGIEIAIGEYYTFVDSDDWLDRDFCDYCKKIMDDCQADIVSVSLKRFSEDGVSLSSKASEKKWCYSAEEALLSMFNPNLIRWCAQAKLYKASLFETIRYPVGMTMEDKATTYKLFSQANKIVFIDTYKYNYLIRKGSIMRSSFSNKDKESYLIQQELNRFLYNNYPKVVSYSYAHTVRTDILLLSKMVVANEIDITFAEQLFNDMNTFKLYFLIKNTIDWRYKIIGVFFLLLHRIHKTSIYSKSIIFKKICNLVVLKHP